MPPTKQERKGTSFPVLFAVGMTLLLPLLAWKDPGRVVYDLENNWRDFLFRVRGTIPSYNKLQIVAVDDYSIAGMGPWPWKRGVHAQVIRKLKALGVKAVGFDVFFIDPNPADPKGDKELVAATREAGNVIHLVDLEQVRVGTMTHTMTGQPFHGLSEAAAMLAHPRVEDTLDRDGVLRRTPLYDYSGSDPLPLLGSALWLKATDRKLDELGEFPDVLTLNFRGPVVMPGMASPTVRQGAFHFVHAADLFPADIKRSPPVDIYDLENDRLTPQERRDFKGGVVLVGSTAIGAFDHYPSAFDSSTPGVIVHANVFDNLWGGDWMRPAPRWAMFALIFALIWLAFFLNRLAGFEGHAFAGIALLGLAVADFLLMRSRVQLEFVAPSGSFLVTYVGLTVHKVIVEGREKRWIKNTFGQYLSPKVVEALVSDPSKVKLGGEKRDMSVFFLDIAHFTNISEKLTPEQLTEFLNEYLSALTDVILKYDGVVDKFIGDCIMAFWNAPVDQARHREFACLAAIECLQTIDRLNKTFIKEGEFPEMPAVRIGLNAGDVVVGNMGSRTRFSYTVIGDEVNLASRLEGANKYFGTHLMASEAVYSGAKDKVEARELGQVRVVGKAIPIRVFELLAKKGELSESAKKALDSYNEGIASYRQRKFEDAAKSFKAVCEMNPGDKPAQMYLNMCQDYALIPPPDDWDGVFNLTSK